MMPNPLKNTHNHAGTMVFFTWFFIPTFSLVLLAVLFDAYHDPWIMLGFALAVFMLGWVITVAIQEASGRRAWQNSKQMQRQLLIVAIKAMAFAIVFVLVVFSVLAGIEPVTCACDGRQVIDVPVLVTWTITQGVLYLVFAILANVNIGGKS